MTTRALRAAAWEESEPYGGVLSRRLLCGLGISRQATGREIASGRWRSLGRHTVAMHAGPLPRTALFWRALWETGAEAALDGVSALQAAGLTGFESDVVHVSVPSTHRPAPVPGVRIHVTAPRDTSDVVVAGTARVRPAVAVLRAAHWAASDRQAALLICLTAQQRLVRDSELLRALDRRQGRTRRAFVRGVVRDVADGVHALGELDFARLCRDRGLPEPTRQVVRRGPRGRIYLDVAWEECGVVVEVDGSQHRQGLAVTDDNLRRNAHQLGGEIVLGIDLVGLRLESKAFLDQVADALRVGRLRRSA